jgi:hypothetical protein
MIFAIIWAWILGHESGRNRCRQVVRQPRTFQYNHFFNLNADVKSEVQQINTTVAAVNGTTDATEHSRLNSVLLGLENICITNTNCSGGCTNVVESMGDDGSFGPEECQAQGIFAFTADSNSLVEWCGPWFYSDAPLKLTSQPLILVDRESTYGYRVELLFG